MKVWLTENWLPLLSIAIVAIAVVVIVLVGKKQRDAHPATTRELTFGAVCIATAFALSFFGYGLPQGGTITPASTLPIMIYCHYFGIKKGAIVCTAFTLLQFMQNPYILTPFQVILDYFIPYLALIFIAVIPFNRDKYNDLTAQNRSPLASHVGLFIGGGIYAVVRYISHVLSGAIFFGEYAWAGWAKWPYSFAYNTFALVDVIIALAVALAIFKSKAFNAFMAKSFNGQQKTACAEKND